MRQIELRNLVIHCIIGGLEHERRKPQRVVVSASVQLCSDSAALSGNLGDTVDYAQLAQELAFILQSAHFYLLESAVDALAKHVSLLYSQHVAKVEVSISKPDVLANVTPRATIELSSDAVDPKRANTAFGYVDTVQETKHCGVYILNIIPKNSIATHYHVYTKEHEMILTDALHLQGRLVNAGTSVSWPFYFPHRYDNHSDQVQKILCIDKPTFQLEDEVPTDCDELHMP